MSDSPAPLAPAAPPPPPARVDLRPLTTSELIDRGFTLYRSHFAGLLMLALLSESAPLLAQLAMVTFKLDPNQNDLVQHPELLLEWVGIMFAISLVAKMIAFCFKVVMTFYIGDAYLGVLPSVKESLKRFTSRFVSTIWTGVLNFFFIGLAWLFPVAAMIAIVVYARFSPPSGSLGILGLIFGGMLLFFASLVPVLIVFMRLSISIPAIALERLSGWKALRRSSSLVRYDPGLGFLYWGEMRLSFLLLPLFVIEFLMLMLTSLPVTIHQIVQITEHGSGGQITPPPDSIVILCQLLGYLARSLVSPLYVIATTVFYYDVRIRREGFDLEFMSGQLENRK